MICDNCKEPIKKRTSLQNRSLHLYFRLLAEELNEAGFDMRRTLREDIDIPWTPDTIKEYLWRKVQRTQFTKTSTTKLTTKEITQIYETINRYIGEKFGIHVPFPSNEPPLYGTEVQNEKK